MFYKVPTNVFFEEECVNKNKALFSKLGKKALIITGKSAEKNGSLADVKEAFDSLAIEYFVYDSIKQNPEVEQVMEVRNLYKDQHINFVVGIGGGSAMDAAKAIAVMLYHTEKEADYLYDKKADHKALPVVAIPTTCGTGSEVTAASVLTRHDIQFKQSITSRIYPTYGFVDIKYIENLPQSILVNTSVDAFAHLVESYISTKATDFSEIFVKEGMNYWGKCKEVLLGNQRTKEDLYYLMMASVLGGMSIAHCGTSLPHGASYVLTYDYDIPHGLACGYFLNSYMEAATEKQKSDIVNWTGFNNLEQLQSFIDEICQFKPLSKEVVDKCASILLSNPAKLANSPLDNSKETVYTVVSRYLEK